MNLFKSLIFKKLLSEWFPFSWIDGHKKQISRVAATISSALLTLAVFKPDWVPFITEGQALITTVLSLVGIDLAEAHDEIKTKEGFGA